MSFEFYTRFQFQFGASRYIRGLYWRSEKKVIVVWIWYELPFSIWSVSIYYGTRSDIRIKSYCRLNLLRASVFNLERLDILRDSIGHPSKKLLSLEFAQSFRFQLRASWYIMHLNRTSDLKVMTIWISPELPLFNLKRLDILCAWIWPPCEKLWPF